MIFQKQIGWCPFPTYNPSMVLPCILDQIELPSTAYKVLCDLAFTFLSSLLIHCFLLTIIHPTISKQLPLSKHALLFLCLPVIAHVLPWLLSLNSFCPLTSVPTSQTHLPAHVPAPPWSLSCPVSQMELTSFLPGAHTVPSDKIAPATFCYNSSLLMCPLTWLEPF